MRTNELVKCDSCPSKEPYPQMKRIGKKWRCKRCYRKKRKEKRDLILHTEGGVRRKSELEIEWQKKREQRSFIPKIKGQKDTSRITTPNQYKGMFLTSLEKYIIYKKYSRLGYSSEFIRKRYNEIKNQFESMITKWQEEKMSDEQINRKFKEEFAKLIQ